MSTTVIAVQETITSFDVASVQQTTSFELAVTSVLSPISVTMYKIAPGFHFIAGETIGGQRVVAINPATSKLVLADSTNIAQMGYVVGLSSNSAFSGDVITVQDNQVITDSGWSWDITKANVFLGINGQMTQTAPTVGFLCQVAMVLNPTSLMFSIKQPILL